MESYGNDLNVIVQQMNDFHLKWIALNNRCKTLQASLTKANSKNEELEMKLVQSRKETKKTKEENRKLIVIVKKLERKLQTGSVYKLIDVLKQTISKYDESILPGVSKLTQNITNTDDDLNISGSEEENDSLSLAIQDYFTLPSHSVDNAISKSIESGANLVDVSQCVQDARSRVIAKSHSCNITNTENDTTLASTPKNVLLGSAPSINTIEPSTRTIQNEGTIDTGCDSRISSSSVVISSIIVENPEEKSVISQTSCAADQYISSTSSQNNVSSTHEVFTPNPSKTQIQMSRDDINNIESLCIIEEQISENDQPSSVMVNPSEGTSTHLIDIFPSTCVVQNTEITNQENSDEKPNVVVLPIIVVTADSKDDDPSCEVIELEPRKTETNQSERLKRSCPSPSSVDESAPKRPIIYKPSSSSANTSDSMHIKCLICEYENLDDSKTYETYLNLDEHIIEKHPYPYPPYKRCMFNKGQCKRHFHPKQNYYKHVKRAHSEEDLDSNFETNNEQRPFKCATCNKLFLFESDFKDHSVRLHNKSLNKKSSNLFATLRNVVPRKKLNSKEKSQFETTLLRPPMTRECEVCKKDNRPSIKYRLYDELDAHISKCHSDPFPEYYRCPYCKRHFRNVKWLTSHIIKKHSNKYSSSPLEKFLQPAEILTEDDQQATNSEGTSKSRPTTPAPKEIVCPLRILSPSTINNAISSAFTSLQQSNP